jgi:hypothetical protein
MAYGIIVSEVTGAGYRYHPWAARLTGLCPKYGFRREFINGIKDWTHVKKAKRGERWPGVYIYYAVPPGLYEINHRMSKGRQYREYILVLEGGELKTISKDEAKKEFKNG